MYNEWELLVVAEDIEPGDTLVVERDSGTPELMVFVEESENNTVILKDANGSEFSFSVNTLEEYGGYRFIVGKSDEELVIGN